MNSTNSYKNLMAIFLMLISNIAVAQNIAINTTGNAPDSSAMLDVQSTTKGLLIPRMTTAQRTAIASPATGLLVFDNTTASFWFKSSTQWVELTSGNANNVWTKNASNVYVNNGENVGIGTNNPVVRLQVNNGADVTNDSGGYLQLGGSSNKNLAFDNNEIEARNNAKASDLYMQAGGGNVGIGTSNAEVKLQVNNGTDLSAANGGYVQLGAGTSANLAFDNNEMQARNNKAASSLYLQHSGGDLQIGASGNGTTNVHINNGKLEKTNTGGFNMMPLCYGNVNANGTVASATPNVTISRLGKGQYSIKCSDVTASTITVGSLKNFASDEFISLTYDTIPSPHILVVVYSLSLDDYNDTGFSFICYNP